MYFCFLFYLPLVATKDFDRSLLFLSPVCPTMTANSLEEMRVASKIYRAKLPFASHSHDTTKKSNDQSANVPPAVSQPGTLKVR